MNLIGMRVKTATDLIAKIIRIDTVVITPTVDKPGVPIYMALVLNDKNRLDVIGLGGCLVLHEV